MSETAEHPSATATGADEHPPAADPPAADPPAADPPAADPIADALPTVPRRRTLAYTFGTLVTDLAQYQAMRRSFTDGGFTDADCEYLTIDNRGGSTGQTSAYAGLNQILDAARGRHVILCHQDVRLLEDGRAELDRRLAELAARHPDWGVAGNAGGVGPGRLAIRITDPHGADTARGPFPARVDSLDENFMVVRGLPGLAFSRDLGGFHFYGTDLCLVAATLGHSCWVIDFHLRHLSPGNARTPEFAAGLAAVQHKWSRVLRPRFVQTTCALLVLSGSTLGRLVRRAAARHVARRGRDRDRSGS